MSNSHMTFIVISVLHAGTGVYVTILTCKSELHSFAWALDQELDIIQ